MYLEKLQVRGIRNILKADLDLSPGANLFYGLNGSGKTSLLEAVHILARGRSFRSRNLRTVINFAETNCTCFGRIISHTEGDSLGAELPIGVSRDDRGKFVFKVGGNQVTSASQLAEVLPIQVINSESFSLLEGSPGVRRGFVDWGVFHVEHSYKELWSRFQRCLKHRNSLLRHGKIDRLQLSIWDREFIALAEKIDSFRRGYLEALGEHMTGILEGLGLTERFIFRYLAGWDRSLGLEEQLAKSLPRDHKGGFSHIGPHRAELKIYAEKQLAADVLSRGQIKSLIFGLKIAQGKVLREKTGQQCVYLLDDLPSELDAHFRCSVSNQLSKLGVQVLITGVERKDLESLGFSNAAIEPRLFHVKQGQVTRV